MDDNNYVLRTGDPIGERPCKVARTTGMLVMMCGQSARERGLATGEPVNFQPAGTVAGVQWDAFRICARRWLANPPARVITP